LSRKEDVEGEPKGIAMNATDRLVLDSSIALRWCFAVNLARSQNLSAYDACYLELALRLGLPLATLDAGLKAAAVAAAVPIYQVPTP
jgi:hypothetical protein